MTTTHPFGTSPLGFDTHVFLLEFFSNAVGFLSRRFRFVVGVFFVVLFFDAWEHAKNVGCGTPAAVRLARRIFVQTPDRVLDGNVDVGGFALTVSQFVC